MKKILVIGSTVADVIVNLDVLPKTAEDVHIKASLWEDAPTMYPT